MNTNRTPNPRRVGHRTLGRGFTLVELLVSISVIVVLVAIVSAVGSGALSGQKAAQTNGVLRALDRALEEYVLAVGSFPKYRPADYVGRPGVAWDYASGILGQGDTQNLQLNRPAFAEAIQFDPTSPNRFHARKPSAGVFVSQAKGIVESDAILSSLPQGVLHITPRNAFANQVRDDNALTVLDGWSVPVAEWAVSKQNDLPAYPAVRQSYIVYVHPENLVAQSLYGDCQNGRPYFMSAGPDRLVGIGDEAPKETGEDDVPFRTRIEKALQDNLYSYPVGKPDVSTDVFNVLRAQ